jgi:hypothetical protein
MVEVVLVVIGLLPIVAAVILVVAGARRLRGRRSRFDGVFDAIATARDAGVYPPSLRGDVSSLVDSGQSVSQSANAIRHTPAREFGGTKRSGAGTGAGVPPRQPAP